MEAKLAAGYFTDGAVLDATGLAEVHGRQLTDGDSV
jgi:hypothetical protein